MKMLIKSLPVLIIYCVSIPRLLLMIIYDDILMNDLDHEYQLSTSCYIKPTPPFIGFKCNESVEVISLDCYQSILHEN